MVSAGTRKSEIFTRAVKWPDLPTTEWKEGTEQKMGTMSLPIPASLKPGVYEVATGLFNPEKKQNPPMLGGSRCPLGTLRIVKERDGRTALTFKPMN